MSRYNSPQQWQETQQRLVDAVRANGRTVVYESYSRDQQRVIQKMLEQIKRIKPANRRCCFVTLVKTIRIVTDMTLIQAKVTADLIWDALKWRKDYPENIK